MRRPARLAAWGESADQGRVRFSLLKGRSQYGSLRLHVDQLGRALADLGHEARIVDLTAEDSQVQLERSLDDLPDCFVGFNGVGSDLKLHGESAYDRLGRAYAAIYVDHPAHHQARLANATRRSAAFFLDRSHVQFMTASPQSKNFAYIGLLPPGANELDEPADLSDEAFARRDIPVLFTGTYRGAPKGEWRDWADSPAKDICEGIAARMAADARLPVLDGLKAVLGEMGAELTPALMADCLPLLRAPQAFAEAYHRDRLVHALGAAGLPLHIWGNGWAPVVERFPALTYGGVGSFEETLHLLRRARVVLNTNNGFLAGGHERVFTAMCAGAAVFSDNSKYYADVFKADHEIATFEWPQMDRAPKMLADLLADEPKLARMARAGAKKAQAEHRWSDRANRLVKAVRPLAA